MPHYTNTPKQRFAHERLLHIQRINKTPMTPRQAVVACRQLSDKHTFIANEHQGIHLSSYGEVSDTSEYIIAVFDGMNLVSRHASKEGFESLIEEVKAFLHPLQTLKQEDPDPDRFANDEERHEFESSDSDDKDCESDEDE
jgi:hypothetical protein